MLVAPLILDLGNRLDLNVHGNILQQVGQTLAHAGNQGGYPTEVNLSQVLAAAEATNLFVGLPNTGHRRRFGRYGSNRLPDGVAAPNTGPSPHLYAATDFNGTVDPAPSSVTGPMQLPGQGTTPVYSPFPAFPNGYGNGGPSELTNAQGQLNHPLVYNSMIPLRSPLGDDTSFPTSSMVALLRSNGQAGYTPPGDALPPSDLLTLCPTSFSNLKVRNLCGVYNTFALDRPALTPYVWDPADSTNTPTTRYQYTSAAYPPPPPTGQQPIAYPALTLRSGNPPANSDYDNITWRGIPKAYRPANAQQYPNGPSASGPLWPH